MSAESMTTHSDTSTAFDLLHPKVQRWIWLQGWDALRDIQEGAIPHLLDGSRDLIISAGTASGKTEAAFLPIISRLAAEGHQEGDGFGALYVSPMKALINNQFERMESLCEEVDIPVVKWHGDVSASVKAKARKKPGGIVLITPESLEAMLINRGSEAARLFRSLSYAVIDEMHAFMDVARGKQLQSLLHRIQSVAQIDPCRVGLSATLADETTSKRFLRPLNPDRVHVLPGGASSQEIKLQVRGYVSGAKPEEGQKQDWVDPAELEINLHLFRTLQGGRHLIFAGSRNRVESVTVALAGMTEAVGLPPEFFAHHGNLAKEFREESEARMRDTSRPASIVCTSTLEMGIDVGDIETVAQIGAGHTVSGMRQRLGRTGRRAGRVSVMRVYMKEAMLADASHPLDQLRRDTVQTIAMVNLMLMKWNEPPTPGRRNLSTALHQVLALIAQFGGISPVRCWDYIGKSGVFETVDVSTFKSLLRQMAEAKVIEQSPDGTLLPGPVGEGLLAGKDIYSVFMTPDEYRVVTESGKAIGQVPALDPILPGQFLLLGGRRWQVVFVNQERKEILVKSASGGKPPRFGGEPRAPEDGVVAEMRRIYETTEHPAYLDKAAADLLSEGRESYDMMGLRQHAIIGHADSLLLFPWVGSRKINALFLALAKAEVQATQLGLALSVPRRSASELFSALEKIASSAPPEPLTLAEIVRDKGREKYDHFLGDDLQALAYASEYIESEPLPAIAGKLLAARSEDLD